MILLCSLGANTLHAQNTAQPNDKLRENMSPNDSVALQGINFEVFRVEPSSEIRQAFDLEPYRVRLSEEGWLYQRSFGRNEWVEATSNSYSYSAKFIVNKQGHLFIFNEFSEIDSTREELFLSSEYEIIAAGNIIVSKGKILAMSPLRRSGFPQERNLIRFLLMLRERGYQNFPLLMGRSLLSSALSYFQRQGEVDFYKKYQHHLEDMDFLASREGLCDVAFLRRDPKSLNVFKL